MLCVCYYNMTNCISRTYLVLVVLFCTKASCWFVLLAWFWFWTGLVVFLWHRWIWTLCSCLQYQGCCRCFNAVQRVSWARHESRLTLLTPPHQHPDWTGIARLSSCLLSCFREWLEFTPASFHPLFVFVFFLSAVYVFF